MTEQHKIFIPNVIWHPELESYLRDALGSARFEATAAALCRPPRTTCLRVNTLQATPQDVLSRVRQMLGTEWPQDVVQLHPQVPVAVLLRGSGPHEVSYEAAGGKEVVVSRKAGEAVLRGAAVYAPGVLAASSGVARGDLVALAVAGEKPGSDTPEITRGTTLYDTSPPVALCNGAVQPPAGRQHANAGAKGECTAMEPGSSPRAGAPVAATALTTSAATAGVGNDGGSSSDPSAAAIAVATAPTAPPPPPPTRHHGPRRRQRRRDPPHGATPGLPTPQLHSTGPQEASCADPTSSGPPAPVPSAGCELIGGSGAGGHGDDSTAKQTAAPAPAPVLAGARAPPSGACGAGLAEVAPTVLPPGWTASSQGPLAPRSGMYVGLARAAMSRQEMFRCREGLALELVDPVFRVPPAVAGLPTGWVMLQNLPSVVAGLVLAPAPGCRLLDMCAAPGGKTTLLAAMMENKGEIIAFDRTHSKAAEVVALAKEMGATCVRAYKMDAGKALTRPMGQHDTAASGPSTTTCTVAPSSSAAPPEGCRTCTTEGHVAAGANAAGEVDTAGHTQSGGLSGGAAACHDKEVGVVGSSGGTATAAAGAAGLAGAAATPAASCGSAGGRSQLSEKARLREERRRAAMLRRGIVPPLVHDASGPPPGSFPPESFDAVLLDAPCSALGLRPRLQQAATATYLRQCAAAQRRLVDGAVRLLRVGGSLVYSTCTINPGENEAIVRYLLDKYGSSLRLVPAGPPFLGGHGLVGRHPTMTEAGVPLQEPPVTSLNTTTNRNHLTTLTATGKDGSADSCSVNCSGSSALDHHSQSEDAEAATATPFSAPCTSIVTTAQPAATEDPAGLGLGPGGGEAWLTMDEAACVQRFDPADPDLDTIGFFVAKFLKTGPIADQL